MKKLTSLFILLIMFISANICAGSVTPLQYFYMVKKVFPEKKTVSVFLPASIENEEKPRIAKAAVKMGVKVVLHLVTDVQSVKENLALVDPGSVVVVYASPELESAIIAQLIVSHCTNNKIPLVSSSKKYSDQGALIALLPGEDNKIQLTINLKESMYMADRFNEQFLQQIGAAEVIRN